MALPARRGTRIVGISGYTVRPRRARDEKPRVSAFLDGKIDKIVALEPDLVIGFSDMQAALADKLIRAGLNVFITNQRSVAEIFATLRLVAGLVQASDRAEAWIAACQARHAQIAAASAAWPRRPRVYFEEWDDPMISAIRWVSELVGVAGGVDVSPSWACTPAARTASCTSAERAPRARPHRRQRCEEFRGANVAARRAGRTCPRWRTASCTRSSPATSCSRARPR